MGFSQKEWLVYFYEAKDHHWSLRFFKKNFKHCGVIGYFENNDSWILLEYIYGKFMVELLTKKDVDSLFLFIKDTNGKIIKVPVKNIEKSPMPNLFGSWLKEHSCVSYVQRLLGLNHFFIFTPYRLFCALKKKGFREMKL